MIRSITTVNYTTIQRETIETTAWQPGQRRGARDRLLSIPYEDARSGHAGNRERAIANEMAASFASLFRGKFRWRYDALLLVILK